MKAFNIVFTERHPKLRFLDNLSKPRFYASFLILRFLQNDN